MQTSAGTELLFYTKELGWVHCFIDWEVAYMNKTTSATVTDAADICAQQPCRAQNIDAIVQYYLSGIKQNNGKVGIELEHFIVHKADSTPVTYSEEYGVRWILEQLMTSYPRPTYDGDHDLIGLSRLHEGVLEGITLEPAAQLELSAGPFDSLFEAQECFAEFEEHVASIIDGVGEQILLLGYQPNSRAQDTELIPKRRYKFMDMYLGAKGPYGPCMMRGTASTQVSIDFTSEEDCIRKLRLASKMVPILSLITDNSPLFEAEPRTHELMRTEVWKYCDPDRCGLVPGVLDDDFTLQRYAEYILDTPAILIPCEKNGWCYEEKTFGEVYAATPMKRADVEHAISMLFNDIRLKTYVEIRPADAMPIDYVIGYAALIKGMFSSDKSMSALEAVFEGARTEADVVKAKEELMSNGYDAEIYGQRADQIADRMCMIARLGLAKEERDLIEPLLMLVMSRKTIAELTIIE